MTERENLDQIAVDRLMPIHQAQLLSYLKLSGCKVGLLINFNVRVLKDGIRRVVNSRFSAFFAGSAVNRYPCTVNIAPHRAQTCALSLTVFWYNQFSPSCDVVWHGFRSMLHHVIRPIRRQDDTRGCPCYEFAAEKSGSCLHGDGLSLHSAVQSNYPQAQIAPFFSPICVICNICGRISTASGRAMLFVLRAAVECSGKFVLRNF